MQSLMSINIFSVVQFACINCERPYETKMGLNLHLRYHCGKEPSFQCPYCHFRTYQKGNLKKHVYRIHKQMYN